MDDLPRPGWMQRLQQGSGRTATSWPTGTTVQRDVPYGRRPAQRLDLYIPPAPADCPVMVIVHGGAWMAGDKANPPVVTNKVAHWLPRGWIVASVNYRLLPWADPLQQASDVAQALAAVQTHVGRWGGDATRVVLVGHSTGAHLGALALADASLGEPFGLQTLRAAVLMDTAALDVVQMMEGPHLPLHDRAFGSEPGFWIRSSPWHQLKAATVPLLLLSSAQREDSTAQSARFAARAVELGGRAEFQPIEVAHSAMNEQLGLPGPLTDCVDDFLRTLGLP